MVGAFAAGTIVDPLTAHSQYQYMSGMIWGIGAALLEKTDIDLRHARVVNDNLGDRSSGPDKETGAGEGNRTLV